MNSNQFSGEPPFQLSTKIGLPRLAEYNGRSPREGARRFASVARRAGFLRKNLISLQWAFDDRLVVIRIRAIFRRDRQPGISKATFSLSHCGAGARAPGCPIFGDKIILNDLRHHFPGFDDEDRLADEASHPPPQMNETPDIDSRKGPRVWAIGGGKGGVGKSVIAVNLAATLAVSGNRVALVDADLGGANLHTLLGIPNPKANLSDFLSTKVSRLAEVMTPTPVDNLWLVSGAKALVEMANPNFGQKGKILRHINALHADHVILDLGAGTAFNVLDFFLVARKGVLVVVPEPTSVENAYHFLKAAFFRKLKRAEPRPQVRAAVRQVMNGNQRYTVRTPRELIARAWDVDPEVGAALLIEAGDFRPALIVNRADNHRDEKLGADMKTACQDYFGIRLQYLGALPNDQLIVRSVLEKRPAAKFFPQIPFVTRLRAIADELTYVRPRQS
jgi:flagellar biosynthesis protein FlhG